MASIQQRGDKWQVRIKNKILPKPLFYTFDTEEDAKAYAQQATVLLKQGVVPQALMNQAKDKAAADDPAAVVLTVAVREYCNGAAAVTQSDRALLTVMHEELKGLRVGDVTYKWVEAYVQSLKVGREGLVGAFGRRLDNLTPGSIRKRVGALARVLDWYWRKHTPAGQQPPVNPLRSLPRGYSLYSDTDAAAAKKSGHAPKRDVSRDRRMTPDEERRVLGVLSGELEVPPQEGCLPVAADPEMWMLIRLLLDTGLRLREAYTLRVRQLQFRRGFIDVAGTKGHRGVIKPRTVPLRRSLSDALQKWVNGRGLDDLVFSFWDGTEDDKKRCTDMLSSRFRGLFRRLGVYDFREHDLRHSACCSWFELRDAQGRWVFSDVEICKIMGWSNYAMVLRYASLRGEDLASRLEHL